VIFVHETHALHGSREDEFEALFRDAWLPAVARSAEARVLYFLKHAHGSGPSYRVVTITGVAGAAAWGDLVESVASGPLREVAERLDACRHEVGAKLLAPLPWSPLQRVDLASVPVAPAERPPALFMEDTVWPYEGRLEEYVAKSGSHYAREMEGHERAANAILQVQGAFRTVYGGGVRREIVLWQRVVEPRALVPLLTREVPPQHRAPGTWMHDALALRDQWCSRLLRTAAWSPLP
jgi:hypothetical protein